MIASRFALLTTILLLASCQKEEENPPRPTGPQILENSNLPSIYAGKSINKVGCVDFEDSNYEMRVWNPFTDENLKGEVVVNGYSKYLGVIPKTFSKAIVVQDSFENLGFNYLIFHADSFAESWGRVMVNINSGQKTEEFPLLSDIENSEGVSLVLKHESIQCGMNSGIDTAFGQLVIWLDYDPNCGNILVEVTGSESRYTSRITRYYLSPDIPTCGSRGCANFYLNDGDYSYSAFCDGISWGPISVTIEDNICRRRLLE